MIKGPTTPPKVTPKQGQYLAFIQHYTLLNGRAPAEVDIARHLGVLPSLVHQMVVRLKERGLIAHTPGQPRSIRVLVPADGLPPLTGEASTVTAPTTVAPLDGRADLVARVACRMVSKMFDYYEAKGMDDSEFAPFIWCIADSVDEELRDAGLLPPESAAARKRVLNLAVETYVSGCAANDPNGADAEGDAGRFRHLMAPTNGRPTYRTDK
jgi:hypothetical protein